jgi:hypothetical protein
MQRAQRYAPRMQEAIRKYMEEAQARVAAVQNGPPQFTVKPNKWPVP